MASDVLISELLDLPDQVHRGDFVLNLSEGVTRPEATLRDYVVTPQLADCFDNALGFIRSALNDRSSKAAYLHGSFGSGKSHFMAVLHLLLQHDARARAQPGLEKVCVGHDWVEGKRFLLVPYHMIGSKSMESAILGGYAEHVRTLHPDAPWPGIYLADDLFADAVRQRELLGDDRFFAEISKGQSKWGKMAAAWSPETFQAAMAAPPGDDRRGRLVGDLVKHLFTSYGGVSAGKTESFLPLDKGLSVLSRHARDLGYDGLLLFLDELILWLATHAANPDFVHQEGSKLGKLVESQSADRPVPIISFVARQRDLRDLIGTHAPGAERLAFADSVKWWEGRFHTITLEDRNLPVIAERRVLRPRDESCRAELRRAFEQAAKLRPEVMQTLLTHEGDREMFRQVYPFSPALVQTLVAVSSVLQRERTALKIMLQLLVGKRHTLKVGDLIPAGDLWDVVAHGEEVFSDVMKAAFDNAKRLYQGKLRPLLEELNEVRPEHDRTRADEDPELARKLQRFDNDDRLVKTLLLSALVPEVEPLKDLTASRLAALNHGTIKAPVPGGEGRVVLGKVRTWASRVGEIRVGEGSDPVISVQIVGVDTGPILEKARAYDNHGNRIRKVKQLLFESLGVPDPDEMFSTFEFTWRGSPRRCDLLNDNVRELPDESLKAGGDDWKVVIDWPFDDPGHTPVEDHARLDAFLQRADSTRTLAWLPTFFTPKTQDELGKLVILDELLKSDRLDQYADHLSAQDRLSARLVLENQRSALANALRLAVHAAYGIAQAPPGTLDTSHEAGDAPVRSLDRGFTPQIPVGADLGAALTHLLDQAFTYQYPDHPQFERRVTRSDCEKVLAEVQRAARAGDGRVAVDRSLRGPVKLVANPLGLGHMGEQYLVLERHWVTHFHKQLAAEGKTSPTVGELRNWLDRPRPRGLAPEVGNLVILAFAEQTDRGFVLHGRPFAPSLDRLPGGVELRQQPLPSQDEWEAARTLAADVFDLGRDGAELLTAANVAALAGKVEEAAEAARPSCRALVRELRQAMARLGIDEGEAGRAPRLRTARAVESLLSGLEGREPTFALQHLAAAPVATSAPAMGRSLAQAGGVSAVLRDTRWELIDAVGHLADGRQADAERLLGSLREAIVADEYAVPLIPLLEQAQVDAIRLLAPKPAKPGRRPPEPGPGPEPRPGKTWQPIREGVSTITPESAEAELETLARLLRDGPGTRRLVLSWRLEGEEPAG